MCNQYFEIHQDSRLYVNQGYCNIKFDFKIRTVSSELRSTSTVKRLDEVNSVNCG